MGRDPLDELAADKGDKKNDMDHMAVGQRCWQGTGAPWERCKKKCPLCGCTHGTTVHNRLIQCPVWEPEFRKVWTNSWGDWATQMEDWYNKATPEDKHHISELQIPESLIEALQPDQKRELRRQVA